MKKMITMVVACVCALALIFTLAGCSISGSNTANETSGKGAVCYVIANTANSQGLNMNSPLVQDTVYSTVRNYGYISVVNVDGSPEVVLANSFDIDEKYKTASKEKLDMDARSKATNLIASMQNIVANDPEADYMEALRLAVRSMSSLEGYDSKTIIVLGTGLGTSGTLDFRNNLLSAEPEAIVDILREKEEVPDFTGMTVYWQQMGDVAAPQQTLTSAQRNRLQEIYGSLVEAGGGTFEYNDIMANPVNENAEYPMVTPVDLPADTPIYFEPEALETDEAANVFKEPVVLSEEQVTFVGDKWEYLYPDEAVKTLQPIADYLMHNQVTILLCGTTAGDEDSEYTLTLSKNRAETVKNTLTELGVDADRIIVVGLGSHDPWHVYGVGYEGTAASGNRKVVLLDASTETAQSILNQSNQ